MDNKKIFIQFSKINSHEVNNKSWKLSELNYNLFRFTRLFGKYKRKTKVNPSISNQVIMSNYGNLMQKLVYEIELFMIYIKSSIRNSIVIYPIKK